MTSTTPFNTLLVILLPRLKSYAMWLTRNGSAADDLVQETSYRILRSESQFTMGTNFPAWAFRILRNEYINSLRRAKRTPVALHEISENMCIEQAVQEDAVFRREVIVAMGRLRPSQNQVLELIMAAGLSYDEAAQAIECSVGTIKSRLWRARQQMGILLKLRSAPKSAYQQKTADNAAVSQVTTAPAMPAQL